MLSQGLGKKKIKIHCTFMQTILNNLPGILLLETLIAPRQMSIVTITDTAEARKKMTPPVI